MTSKRSIWVSCHLLSDRGELSLLFNSSLLFLLVKFDHENGNWCTIEVFRHVTIKRVRWTPDGLLPFPRFDNSRYSVRKQKGLKTIVTQGNPYLSAITTNFYQTYVQKSNFDQMSCCRQMVFLYSIACEASGNFVCTFLTYVFSNLCLYAVEVRQKETLT